MDVLDPKIVFMNAFKGALGGAIAGGRRSIDGETLRGVAQGAAMGAVGGVVAGQITEHGLAPLAAGAVTGYVGSRGPRGPSRPQLHLRLDNGQEKQATELPLPLHPDRDTRAVLAVLAVMRGHRRHEPRAATEKHALSAGVVEAAAAKRGVSPRFLQALAKRRTGANKGQALTSWIGSGPSANKYLTSWMANKPHVKHASGLDHAIELAGLGILARPSVNALRGKPMTEHASHVHEVAGLGVLAAPSAVHMAQGAWHKGRQMLASRAMAGKWAPAGRKLLKAAVAGPQNNADPQAVEASRAAVRSTPLGERVLADTDGLNEPPLVAMLALRRLLRSGKPGP